MRLWAHLVQLLKLSHEALGSHDALWCGCTAVRHACLSSKMLAFQRLSLALEPVMVTFHSCLLVRHTMRLGLGQHKVLPNIDFRCTADHTYACLHVIELF